MKDTIIQNIQIQVQENKKNPLNINLLDKKIEVANKTIQFDQVKTPYDYTFDAITGFGVVITAFLSIISIRKLIKKDEQKQEQINELINQTKELAKYNSLYERRIRMINKPRITSGGGTTAGYANEWSIRLENKGENAIITDIEIIGGDMENAFFLTNALPYELDKGRNAMFSGGTIEKNPNEMYLQIRVSFKDIEDYEYQAIFDWKGGGTTLVETKEL